MLTLCDVVRDVASILKLAAWLRTSPATPVAFLKDGVIRGLHEVAKHIDAGKAQVVFLAESCNEPTYKKLVQGLCLEKNVPLIDVSDNKQLGEWAGLCKIDNDGNAKKVVGASCVCVTDFGEEGQAYDYMMSYLGNK